MRKISFIFFLFFSVMSFTFSSFAGVASGSNAMRVPRASWSNASHAWEDFKDSFDQLNDVDLISDRASGLPTFDNTVNYSGVRVGVYYEDVLKNVIGLGRMWDLMVGITLLNLMIMLGLLML